MNLDTEFKNITWKKDFITGLPICYCCEITISFEHAITAVINKLDDTNDYKLICENCSIKTVDIYHLDEYERACHKKLKTFKLIKFSIDELKYILDTSGITYNIHSTNKKELISKLEEHNFDYGAWYIKRLQELDFVNLWQYCETNHICPKFKKYQIDNNESKHFLRMRILKISHHSRYSSFMHFQ